MTTSTDTRLLGTEDMRAWLADHGIDMHYVRSVSFEPQSLRDGKVMLRVERMALNEKGERFAVRDDDGQMVVATEVVWVPLHRMP